jgi:hypothetical protein
MIAYQVADITAMRKIQNSLDCVMSPGLIITYIHTYILTYLHTYICTYIHTTFIKQSTARAL